MKYLVSKQNRLDRIHVLARLRTDTTGLCAFAVAPLQRKPAAGLTRHSERQAMTPLHLGQ